MTGAKRRATRSTSIDPPGEAALGSQVDEAIQKAVAGKPKHAAPQKAWRPCDAIITVRAEGTARRLHTIYGPPEHKDGVVHATKEQGERDHDGDEWEGETTE